MENVETDEARGRERRIALLLSIALFVAACATPALELRSEYAGEGILEPWIQTRTGFVLLLWGWAVVPVTIFAWLANMTILFGWIALSWRAWRAAILLAATSLFFAADLLRLVPNGTQALGPLNPRHYFIERPLIGCYLWLASIVVIAAGVLPGWWRGRTRREAITLAFCLALLLGYALGIYRYLQPFDQWQVETKMPALRQRVQAVQPTNATEEETLAFIRSLGIADEHIRLHLSNGRTERIEGWIPRPRHLFQTGYPDRAVVRCHLVSGQLDNCLVYHDSGEDPDDPPNRILTVTTPPPRR